VQWDGYLKISAPVRMATVSDDQSRMWIDLNKNGMFSTGAPELINNGWGGDGQGMTLGQVSAIIQPGIYPIRIQYEEGAGGNGILLGGVEQAPADAPVLFSNLTLTGSENRMTARQIEGDFTIQFWVRTTQIAGGETHWTDGMGLVDGSAPESGKDFGVSLGNGRILFGTGEAGITTIASGFVADDEWHQVAARRIQSNGELALFIDGIEVAKGPGGTELLDGASQLTIGSLSGGSNYFIGAMDQVRTWETARSNQQIAADYYLSRAAHGFAASAPTVRVEQLQPNSIQIYWDALSSYRTLEGATTIDGVFTPLPTDQNSTNIAFGGSSMRFFRVRQ
jgi:hypothetical protein